MDIDGSYQDATIVPPEAVALIVRADGEVELVIPKDEELNWHPNQMALAQLAIRFLNDPEWVQELAEELKASAS
ncbi:MAG TPA: hypothetical protein VEZ41_14050 [Allosphingosinicella sp.]|nr:hypothetical protein [Allosphingosinicella sp.]